MSNAFERIEHELLIEKLWPSLSWNLNWETIGSQLSLMKSYLQPGRFEEGFVKVEMRHLGSSNSTLMMALSTFFKYNTAADLDSAEWTYRLIQMVYWCVSNRVWKIFLDSLSSKLIAHSFWERGLYIKERHRGEEFKWWSCWGVQVFGLYHQSKDVWNLRPGIYYKIVQYALWNIFFFRKFDSKEFSMKWKLFKMLCLSSYGLNTLCSGKGSSSKIRELSVSYHYVMKRVLGCICQWAFWKAFIQKSSMLIDRRELRWKFCKRIWESSIDPPSVNFTDVY